MTNRIFAAAVLVLVATITTVTASGRGGWTSAQLEELRSMSLAELESLPRDPTNRVADDPRAADLGRRLFFDTQLSSNGRVACSTCHQADRGFQDGIALANGIGTTARRTMPIAGMARSPFLFWDGRKDSLWAQALGPLESPVEHGGTRAQYAHVVADSYAQEYEQIFGPLPDLSGVARSAGPVADRDAASAWSALGSGQRDDVTRVFVTERCSELEFIVTGEHTLDRAYKVPSLRNVAERAPYMDAGQFATLAEVLDHYNRAPAAATGHSELRPLRLKSVELRQIEAFLRTLSGPIAVSEPAPRRTQ